MRKKNSLRVVLSMDLILQSIVVEVDGEELEPVDFAFSMVPARAGLKPGSRAAGEQYG